MCKYFFLLIQLFMGHIVSSLHLLKERTFFFMCILNLVFKFDLCVFFFPHLLNFPQNYFPKNMFCFFPIFIGGEKFFLPFLFIGELLLFIGGVVSIFYRVELFCGPFFLYFLLLCCVCFLFILWLGSLCQYMTKRRRNSWYVGLLFVLFRGSWFCFW